VPSRPGSEALSQAKPGRHPEVAWSRRRDRLSTPFFRSACVTHVDETQPGAACPVCRPPDEPVDGSIPAEPGIGGGAYGPSTEIKTRTNILLWLSQNDTHTQRPHYLAHLCQGCYRRIQVGPWASAWEQTASIFTSTGLVPALVRPERNPSPAEFELCNRGGSMVRRLDDSGRYPAVGTLLGEAAFTSPIS
jgi:hypothetical protein